LSIEKKERTKKIVFIFFFHLGCSFFFSFSFFLLRVRKTKMEEGLSTPEERHLCREIQHWSLKSYNVPTDTERRTPRWAQRWWKEEIYIFTETERVSVSAPEKEERAYIQIHYSTASATPIPASPQYVVHPIDLYHLPFFRVPIYHPDLWCSPTGTL
jgi:hypothetical protein